ncbi:MAG: hypothetical protein WC848_06045 [Parcubacteria group bacterium]|jgi:hypothetical protein
MQSLQRKIRPKGDFPEKPKTPQKAKFKKSKIFLALVILGVVFLGKNYYDTQAEAKNSNVRSISQEQATVLGITDENNNQAIVGSGAVFSSENFKATQLALDDGAGFGLVDFDENTLLKIGDIKSELYSIKEGDKTEIKGLINCSTTKRAKAELEYFKSGTTDAKTIKEQSYGTQHSWVIAGLDADSVYKYSLRSTDVSGSKISSEQFVFYTGAPNVSLIDVLSNAVRKVFGWALGG